jgi:cathepsin B
LESFSYNMKVALIVALVFTAYAGPAIILDETAEVVPQSMVDYINSAQTSWVASKDWVGTMTVGEAKAFVSSSLVREEEYPEFNWGAMLDHFTAPTSFDSRTQWPSCIHPIRDQAQCGSCWAFAASEALSDRFCIASSGAKNVVLSPQYLVDCDTSSYGCNGGYPNLAWRFMQQRGLPLDSCVPYTAKDGTCPSKCADGSAPVFYKAATVASYTTPASIQAAVVAGGPIEVAFTVYQDFMSYTSGVYIHTSGGVLGGHAVKLIGWGVSGSQNYWICANSWNTNWGLQGFFWIGFGQCGIDSQGVAGSPSV